MFESRSKSELVSESKDEAKGEAKGKGKLMSESRSRSKLVNEPKPKPTKPINKHNCINIRDHAGEAAEYEEYFRRLLESTKRGSKKEKEEIHLTVIRSIFTEARTCTHLIEAALKFLYLLGHQHLRPAHLHSVLHFPSVLETYSAYLLAMDASGFRVLQSTSECLDISQRILNSGFPFVDDSYQLSLLEHLLNEAEVREYVSYFLHHSECMLRVLQVARKVLNSAHSSMLDVKLRDELFCHLGSSDGLISVQASLFARDSQRKFQDNSITRIRINYALFTPTHKTTRVNPRPRLDNFLRDGIALLPITEQQLILALVSDTNQDTINGLTEGTCSKVHSILVKHRPDLELTDIPKKVIRHILEIKTVRQRGEQPSDPNKGDTPLDPKSILGLPRGYAEDKRLTHLFESSHRHSECMEM